MNKFRGHFAFFLLLGGIVTSESFLYGVQTEQNRRKNITSNHEVYFRKWHAVPRWRP